MAGFWSPDIIPEDFHTFFKALFKFPKKVSTVPIYHKILSDAAEGDDLIDTIKNNYFQERRWSWGISDDGWILKSTLINFFRGNSTIRSIYISLHVIFDHISSVGVALLVALGGNIPLILNPKFANTVLGFNLPSVSSLIIQLTIFFFLIMILVDAVMKPKHDKNKTLFRKIVALLEWVLQPIIGIFMVVLPGIESHTRLLFGKYLEYYLTKKK